MALPKLTSYQIRDLVSIASNKDADNIVPPYAQLRCFQGNDGTGIPTQILGDKLNVYCTKSQFLWNGTKVEFTPGFSFINAFDAVFDPVTLTMTFTYQGQSVGQVSAEPSQSITKPMSGTVTVFIGLTLVGGESIPIPYSTTIFVSGYPLLPWPTWGDWASHGDVIFPMAVRSEFPDILEIDDLSITVDYVALANPEDLIEVPSDSGAQKAYPFQANKTAQLYTGAQYQLSKYITYIPLNP